MRRSDGISGFLGKCKMLIIKKQEVANRRDGAFGLKLQIFTAPIDRFDYFSCGFFMAIN